MSKLFLTLFTAAVLLAGCKKPEEAVAEKPKSPSSLPPVKVELGSVTHEKMPRLLTLTGSVVADRQSEVAANVSGRVTATYVERGMP
ncbi:MAG: hypothetical protein ABTQ32_08585, partial [Myxococcaceae bacterium]